MCLQGPGPRCFTPHKSWIFGQFTSASCMKVGGICFFLTLRARRHDELSHKNKVSPDTSKDSLSRAHTQLRASMQSHPLALNRSWGWYDWHVTYETLKRSLGIINKTSHLVHETCLLTLFDLIDEPAPGTLHCCLVVHITINLNSRQLLR